MIFKVEVKGHIRYPGTRVSADKYKVEDKWVKDIRNQLTRMCGISSEDLIIRVEVEK